MEEGVVDIHEWPESYDRRAIAKSVVWLAKQITWSAFLQAPPVFACASWHQGRFFGRSGFLFVFLTQTDRLPSVVLGVRAGSFSSRVLSSAAGNSHPYNVGRGECRVSPTRQALLVPSAKRREVFGESHEG